MKNKKLIIIFLLLILFTTLMSMRGGVRREINTLNGTLLIPDANAEMYYLDENGDEIFWPNVLDSILTVKAKWDINTVDLDRLARAVAKHETNDCTTGTARYNNCFGIMTWVTGKRTPKRYKTKEDSYKDFKRIWSTHYKGFPNLNMAIKYSGNDRARIWLRNVTYFYNQ